LTNDVLIGVTTFIESLVERSQAVTNRVEGEVAQWTVVEVLLALVLAVANQVVSHLNDAFDSVAMARTRVQEAQVLAVAIAVRELVVTVIESSVQFSGKKLARDDAGDVFVSGINNVARQGLVATTSGQEVLNGPSGRELKVVATIGVVQAEVENVVEAALIVEMCVQVAARIVAVALSTPTTLSDSDVLALALRLSVRLGMRLRLRLGMRLSVRLSVRLGVRLGVRLRMGLSMRLSVGLRMRL